MTNPLTPDPGQPENDGTDPSVELPVQDHSEDEASGDDKNYVVKTPWYIDSLSGEGFPELNPKGVEMTGAERQKAYEAAKEAGVTLKSKEV